MTEKEFERLQPFLHWKSARQRVILYLIADGYTVPDLVAMSTAVCQKLSLPDDIAVFRDEMLVGHSHDFAFVYPIGKPMPHTAFYRLIRTTALKVTGKPMSQETFRLFIHGKKKAG